MNCEFIDQTNSLVNLLVNLGVNDPKPFNLSEALSKRDIFKSFEYLPSSNL